MACTMAAGSPLLLCSFLVGSSRRDTILSIPRPPHDWHAVLSFICTFLALPDKVRLICSLHHVQKSQKGQKKQNPGKTRIHALPCHQQQQEEDQSWLVLEVCHSDHHHLCLPSRMAVIHGCSNIEMMIHFQESNQQSAAGVHPIAH